MGHDTDEVHARRPVASESPELAPEEHAHDPFAARLPAWSPTRSSLAASLAQPATLTRPDDDDGAPVPVSPSGPPLPDDVEIALLGDADFLPPDRPRGRPPAHTLLDATPCDPAWAARVRAVQAAGGASSRPALDPGAWIAEHHLGPWTRAVCHAVAAHRWPDAPPRPAPLPSRACSRARHDVDRLAQAHLLLLAAPRRDIARATLLAVLPARLDAIELALARADQRVPQSTAFLRDLADVPPTPPQASSDPQAVAWWEAALAVPSSVRWQARDIGPGPAPIGLPGRPTPDNAAALRQAIAWRGVDLYRANLRLRARLAASVRALAELDGPGTGAALWPLAQAVDQLGQQLSGALRTLGQGLHAHPPQEARAAVARLADLAVDHDAARRHAIATLAHQVGHPSSPPCVPEPDPHLCAAWTALHRTDPARTEALHAVADRAAGLAVAAWWARADATGLDTTDGLDLLARCRDQGAHGAAALHAAALIQAGERPRA